MSRLGRGQPIQPRIIHPGAPQQTSLTGTGRIIAAGRKTATGGAVIRGGGLLKPAGSGHAGSGSAAIRAGSLIGPGAGHAPTPTTASLVNSWTAGYTAPAAPAGLSPPGAASLPVQVANDSGNWLFAVVAWRQAPGYPPVTFSVGDGVNWWDPMGAPAGTSPATGDIRVAVWRAPAARPVTIVTAAPTGIYLSVCVTVLEISNMLPWVSEAGTLTVFTADTASLPTLTPPTSPVPVFWLTACARDLASPTGIYPSQAVSTGALPFAAIPGEAIPGEIGPGSPLTGVPIPVTGGTWVPGPSAASGNGIDGTGDLALLTAFQQATGSVQATWAQSAPSGMAAIVTGVLVSAPPPDQPNPAWAPGIFEIAPGAGPGTPPDEVAWVAVDGEAGVPVRMQDFSITSGQQYTVGSLQAGQGAVTIDNRDLAATPPGRGDFAGIDSGVPWRYRGIWPGGGIYPANPSPHFVLSGYTADLPSTWNSTRRGVVTTGLTDGWAYCQPQIQSALREEMLADNPTHLWPCADPAGALTASNLATGSTAPLVQITSKYGNAGATPAFGTTASLSAFQAAVAPAASGGGLPGGGGSVWGQTGLPAAPTSGGYCLYCEDTFFPPLSGEYGMSVECWSAFTDTALQQDATLWAVKGTKGTVMRLWADVTGALWFTLISRNGHATIHSLGSASMIGAGMFQTAVTWLQGTGWTAYVNGTAAGQGGASATLPSSFSWVTAGGEADRQATQNMFDGQTCFLAVFPAALPASRVSTHWEAGNAAFSGEPDHSRAERILSYAGYTGRRVIKQASLPDLCASLADLGTTTAAPAAGTGAPVPAGTGTVQAGQELTGLAASLTPAMLYVAPSGEIVWAPKELMFGQQPLWVLNDSGLPGTIPFGWDASYGWDPQRVLNYVQITQVDRQDIVIPQAFVPLAPGYDAPQATKGQYGQQTYQINGYLYNDLTTPVAAANPSNLLDLANWISITLATPHLRAGQLTIDASTYPAAWPLVLGASPGDVALVGQSPITAGTSISLLARIMRVQRQITWKAGQPKATAVLSLDYAPELSPVILDDPAAGQLTGQQILAW